ncbi:MAG TPA: biopolymer transporter ExbD [Crocinitomix sp.]|nr:biopolymer transporter ExbD [Crocinitomix sp.]
MNLKRKNNIDQSDDGMSSMTDLVFLLLIFFIIMSTMAKSTLPVDLPSGKKTTHSQKDSPVEVGIDAENNYFIDANKTKIYTFDEIIPVLEAKIAEQSTPTLKISGDKNASYEAIFNLIAVSKQKDWKPVLSYKN